MALDSRSKRASSVGFLKPYSLDLVLPDGALDQGDRQHTVWDYSGILITPTMMSIMDDLFKGMFKSMFRGLR